jgi:hypothetical protein
MKIKCLVTLSMSLIAVAGSADALGIGGYGSGFGGGGVLNFCAEEVDGAVTNNGSSGAIWNCNPGFYWEVDLPVNAGTYTPTLGVAWPLGQPMYPYVTCQTVSQSRLGTGSAYQSTGYIYENSTAGSLAFQPGSVTVPNDGYMYVECWIEPQAYLVSVNY